MKVSVALITYNHEKYVSQALDSILMQLVDFEHEIVVGDDYSTDATRKILLAYQEKYPDRVRLQLAGKNRGISHNFAQTINACHGNYIALLEGDDYWSDPHKLQKQVDFLEDNLSFSLCFTDSSIVDENGNTVRVERLEEKRRRNLSQRDILCGCVPPTNTVVFRKYDFLEKMPAVFYGVMNVDMFLFSMITSYGDAAFIDRTTAAYRMHDSGIWAKRPKDYIYSNYLLTRKALLQYYGRTYRDILLPDIDNTYAQLLTYYIETKCFGRLLYCYLSYAIFRIRCHISW